MYAFNGKLNNPASLRIHGSRPSLEQLEAREVPAASITFENATRSIIVAGSEGNDNAEVRQQGSSIVVSMNGRSGRMARSFSTSQVSRIVFNGRAGDDLFSNLTSIPSRADGGAGNDTLRGGKSNDDFSGGDGNDQLSGGFGNDTLDGGIGNDSLFGGTGNDRLMGGDGQDRIFGEDGSDSIWGGAGNDMIDGGAGNDSAWGQDGNDMLRGGTGNDLIDGGNGGDEILGGFGDDSLLGDKGDDALNGESGTDQIVGGAGLDRESDPQDSFADGDSDRDGFDNDYDTMDILYEAPSNPRAYADDASVAPIISSVSAEVRDNLGIGIGDPGLRVRVQANGGQDNQWGQWVTGVWRYLTPDKIQVWGKWAYPSADPSQIKIFVQWSYDGPRGHETPPSEYSNPANYSISEESVFSAGSLNGPGGGMWLGWLPGQPVSFSVGIPGEQATGFPAPIEKLKAALKAVPNLVVDRYDAFSGNIVTTPGSALIQPIVDILRTINRTMLESRSLS